jgi:CheY-like chemotaxis protein
MGIRILLVIDDTPAILDLLQSMLQGIGYEVMTTTDGRSALEQIKIIAYRQLQRQDQNDCQQRHRSAHPG